MDRAPPNSTTAPMPTDFAPPNGTTSYNAELMSTDPAPPPNGIRKYSALKSPAPSLNNTTTYFAALVALATPAICATSMVAQGAPVWLIGTVVGIIIVMLVQGVHVWLIEAAVLVLRMIARAAAVLYAQWQPGVWLEDGIVCPDSQVPLPIGLAIAIDPENVYRYGGFVLYYPPNLSKVAPGGRFDQAALPKEVSGDEPITTFVILANMNRSSLSRHKTQRALAEALELGPNDEKD